jgi:hypothetical protein
LIDNRRENFPFRDGLKVGRVERRDRERQVDVADA